MRSIKFSSAIVVAMGAFATLSVACAPAAASVPRVEADDGHPGIEAVSAAESYIDEHERLLRAAGVEFNDIESSAAVVAPAESYIEEHARLLQVAGVELVESEANMAVVGQACGIQRIAGSWLFATDVGHFPAFGGDITALGTMNIDHEGNVNGAFDVTISEVAFGPGSTYTGSVTVNPNCTGTLTFVTSDTTSRTDSIAIVSQEEMWGMSQDPGNLWTYRVRRISGPSGD